MILDSGNTIRFAPVYWEPVHGTGERIVSMIIIEPLVGNEAIPPAAYVILADDKLKALFGSSYRAVGSLLKEAAAILTKLVQSGESIETVQLPFHGLQVGKARRARGNSVPQMLEAAIRAGSSFGSYAGLVDDDMAGDESRSSVTTYYFLSKLKQVFARGDDERRQRFHRRLEPSGTDIDITIDYSFKKFMLQAVSLPRVGAQVGAMQREAQSKLLELQVISSQMDSNPVVPYLLINKAALPKKKGDAEFELASTMLHRYHELGRAVAPGLEIVEVKTEQEAATVLEQFELA